MATVTHARLGTVIRLPDAEPEPPQPPEPETARMPWMSPEAGAAEVRAQLASGNPDGDAIWRAGIAAGLGGEWARNAYLEPESETRIR